MAGRASRTHRRLRGQLQSDEPCGPRARRGAARRAEALGMRTGSGFNVHAFGPGSSIMLGGVRHAHSRGVKAYSAGSASMQALCDALLGAAGVGYIGEHFANDDPQWRGADSSRFVRRVLALLRERGLRVGNVDITVLAEK